MKLVLAIGFIAFVLIAQSCNVCGELASPENVALQTLNTRYVLVWDWQQDSADNQTVTFTAQYLAKYKIRKKKPIWSPVCEGVSERWCDFTQAELHYLGIWVLRVRASRGQSHSAWVQIDFCPDRDAALGPPSRVEVTPVKGLIQVMIFDPLTSANKSMKELSPNVYYRIQYWRQSSHTQPAVLESSNNLVTVPGLEGWTWYCVRVQSRYDYYNKSSQYSPTQCLQTDGLTPYWQIFLYFTLSLVLCFLLVLLLSYTFYSSYKVIKSTFYPSIQLPAHIQEYLYDSPCSDLPRLLTHELEAELYCDRLDVFPETVTMEIHQAPPEGSLGVPESDSGRHSRHGSGDSGVYSTEGSGPKPGVASQREGVCETPPGAPSGGEGVRETPPDQLKMVEMGGEEWGRGEEEDEGVRDVCV